MRAFFSGDTSLLLIGSELSRTSNISSEKISKLGLVFPTVPGGCYEAYKTRTHQSTDWQLVLVAVAR